MTGDSTAVITYLMGVQKEKPDVIWELKEHKERRSLDSNAYFHVLCDKLRQKLGISMASCKNHLICGYGQIQYIEEGVPLIYKTNAPPEYINELEEPHLLLVKTSLENDKSVFFYRMYRGSHTYNTAEMSALIKGTQAEAEEQGIQAATPDELAHMQELWRRKYEKHSDTV